VADHEVLIIGAGPAGLACAVELSRIQIDTAIVESGCPAQSLRDFPERMRFFSDTRSLEIRGLPWRSTGQRPTRSEAVEYYSDVAKSSGLKVYQQERVLGVAGEDGSFRISTSLGIRRAEKVIIATGFYGQPNLLGIPGESLAKVTHYFRDARSFSGRRVAVIGGRNSAGTAATELAEAGARVVLIHRGKRFGMKAWIASALDDAIAAGSIHVLMNSHVESIFEGFITVKTPQGRRPIANDFVFAMTGYHADLEFLRRNGISLSPCGSRPLADPDSLESSRPGIYLAGTVLAGVRTDEINIETARLHGAKIASAMQVSLRAAA
jgi:thioredoxin reductase (NADPH)